MVNTKYLRLALEIDQREVQVRTQLTFETLCLIESGCLGVPLALSDYYASKLSIDKRLMRILLVGSERRVPFFETIRTFFLKMFNGYLKLSLWMSAFDENSKKIPN
ncbi:MULTISPECIES: hypothetical protein [Marinobacter]|uniref:LysR substrate binding domain-containing protein n=1 Tax=Marinobacter xiaoshiensis TaxID=3073652 RepID=A0ABU2HHM4_9GAMM|nr:MULTISPECIES: hypothetical protein [unclassified Marinobacter]MBK1886091.1 hypothetical protein [Marinobacter sp. DY40_1A1]MDS1310547.1 hypothetical protein [Marinobacter sp. F60267]